MSDLGCLIGRNGGTEWNRCIVTVTVSYPQAHGLRSPWASPTCFQTISGGPRSPSDVHLMWLANKTLLLRDMLVMRCKVGDFSDKTRGATLGPCRCVCPSNTRSFANRLSQKMDGSFSDQERQVNKMLTFLFLLKMHIMDLVSAECFLCLQSARSSTSTQH